MGLKIEKMRAFGRVPRFFEATRMIGTPVLSTSINEMSHFEPVDVSRIRANKKERRERTSRPDPDGIVLKKDRSLCLEGSESLCSYVKAESYSTR